MKANTLVNSHLSLLSSKLKVPLCINFSTLLAIVLLFILLSVAFSHSDYSDNRNKEEITSTCNSKQIQSIVNMWKSYNIAKGLEI